MTRAGGAVSRRTWTVILMLAALLVLGTAGYVIIEGWTFLDSLYMTVITITTVGFREMGEMDGAGRIFTLVLITLGVGTWAYAITSLARLLAEGQLKLFFSVRRTEKMIENLKDHFIVCGHGRIGSLVCRHLKEENRPFVVVESDPGLEEELKEQGYLYVMGDATKEETLRLAGVLKARTLVATLDTDAANVYAVLTARHLNPRLYIVCSSEEKGAEDKMLKAGASKVISPYRIGGRSLAHAATRPYAHRFIELATAETDLRLVLEEVPIPVGSPLAGKSLADSRLRERCGLMIVAILPEEGEMVFNPPADHVIREGDVLVALGSPECFAKLHDEVE